MLPSAFDVKAVELFLTQRDTADNVRKCMKKIRRLVSGQGVPHKERSDVFMQGVPVTPSDDLEELRARANAWLPYTLAKGRVDRTGGWTLNHPITKLQLYKEEALLSQTSPPTVVAIPVTPPVRQSGHIYCFNTVGNHSIYKVGMTEKSTVDARLASYDGGNKPHVVVGTLFVQNAREAETQLIAALKTCGVLSHDRRLGNEWFRATDDDHVVHAVIADAMADVVHRVHRKRSRPIETDV